VCPNNKPTNGKMRFICKTPSHIIASGFDVICHSREELAGRFWVLPTLQCTLPTAVRMHVKHSIYEGGTGGWNKKQGLSKNPGIREKFGATILLVMEGLERIHACFGCHRQIHAQTER
jgi:hypothetical protein